MKTLQLCIVSILAMFLSACDPSTLGSSLEQHAQDVAQKNMIERCKRELHSDIHKICQPLSESMQNDIHTITLEPSQADDHPSTDHSDAHMLSLRAAVNQFLSAKPSEL